MGRLIDEAGTSTSGKYIVVDRDSPGFLLLDSYGLTQTRCRTDVVRIYGPKNSLICAIPTDSVPAGVYTVDPSTLTLIPQ